MEEKVKSEKRKPSVSFRGPSDRDKEFDQVIIDLARVTRVMAGGKRMSFRASVAIGDHKGRVGFGVAKAADVMMAVNKAVAQAKKGMISFPILDGTIPFQIEEKYKAAKILLRPAPQGTGIKAGGSVRTILELGGVRNIVGKILGAKNKINNSRATLQALSKLETIDYSSKVLAMQAKEKRTK